MNPELRFDSLKAGQFIFVNLRSDKETGAAVVLQDWQVPPDGPKDNSEDLPRVAVQFLCCGTEHTVNPRRITPLLWTRFQPTVILTPDTTSYRILARTQLTLNSASLEIGASYGMATEILASSVWWDVDRVAGIEIAKELAEQAKKRSGVDVKSIDVLSEHGWEEVLVLVEGLRERIGSGVNPLVTDRTLLGPYLELAVFLDIGGSRESAVVTKVLEKVIRDIAPDLIVVKCEELADSVLGKSADGGQIPLDVVKEIFLAR